MTERAARRSRIETKAENGQAALRNWLRLLDCSTLVENEVRRRLRVQFDTTLPASTCWPNSISRDARTCPA